LRHLPPPQQALQLEDFASNDYLGLARSPALAQAINTKLAQAAQPAHGATGSRLISGNLPAIEALEQQLAQTFKAPACLLFNNGYVANLALVATLPGKNDALLYDDLSHACIKEGARLSMARHRYAFKHNHLPQLAQKLERLRTPGQHIQQIYIVAEAVYSMDGDYAPLQEMLALAKQYQATLLLDEAHSTGLLGPQGSGLATHLGLEQQVLARVHTFGKAMGVHGAVVAGSAALIQYLINFARPFIYTTAPPLHQVLAIQAAFEHLAANPTLPAQLMQKVQYFRQNLPLPPHLQWVAGPQHPVQALLVPGPNQARQAAQKLQSAGLNVRPIVAPTVKPGTERLRICLHLHNSQAAIDQLKQALLNL